MVQRFTAGWCSTGRATEREGQVTRRTLLGIFLKAGLAFGGGLGILAVLEQELVTRRQAVGREEFLRLYGLGRVVPSGTMTALAVAPDSSSMARRAWA